MLVDFKIENCESFLNKSLLSMDSTLIKAHSYSLIPTTCGRQLLPVAAIYGANASGKTNLLSAFVGLLARIAGEDHYYFCNFLWQKDNAIVSKLSLKYIVCDVEYLFEVHWIMSKCIYEALSSRKDKKQDFIKIYERTWDDKWEIVVGGKGVPRDIENEISYVHEKEKSQDNLLITALGERQTVECVSEFYKWAKKSYCVATEGDPDKLASSYNSLNRDFYLDDEKSAKASKFINRIDPMVRRVGLEEFEETPNRKYYKYSLEYVTGGRSNRMFNIASSGTKKAIVVYPSIDQVLNKGGLLIIDEIENSLHPLIIAEILGMFTNPKTNPGHGQLIFTSHNPIYMDKKYLRADEIWLVDKDDKGRSSLTPLSSYNVRSDLDFCKNYIIGSFGGVPNSIPITGDEN